MVSEAFGWTGQVIKSVGGSLHLVSGLGRSTVTEVGIQNGLKEGGRL